MIRGTKKASAFALAMTLLLVAVGTILPSKEAKAATSCTIPIRDFTNSDSFDENTTFEQRCPVIGTTSIDSSSVDIDTVNGYTYSSVANYSSLYPQEYRPANGYDALLSYSVSWNYFDSIPGNDDWEIVGTVVATFPVLPGFTFEGAVPTGYFVESNGESYDITTDDVTIIRSSASSITVSMDIMSRDFPESGIYDHYKDASFFVSVKSTGGSTSGSQVSGLQQSADGNWYLYNNGVVNTNYTGLYCDANVGWWLVVNGRVAFDYNDLYGDANYGWWKITNGAVDFNYCDLYNSSTYGWWLVYNGAVMFDYSDLFYSPQYGWWKVNGGAVDFGYSDLYCSPSCGWWLVYGGAVNFGYSDLFGSPQYGWWKVNGGAVDFGYTGNYNSPIYGPWNINGGAVVF